MNSLLNARVLEAQQVGIALAEQPTELTNEPVGVSAAWRKLLAQARIAAPHLHVAAIEGEPGTGKTLLARFLHHNSQLAHLRFERHDARQWLASDCDLEHLSGFLYLDRIELLESAGQSLLLSLLKNLQDRTTAPIIVVVSSHTPLRLLAGKGQFIPDLAFRLTSVRFSISPLRQRKEDIPPLTQALLERIGHRYEMHAALLGQGALPVLLQYDWPGNIRELASVLEAALLEATNGIIRPSDLSLHASLHLTAAEQNSLALPLQFPLRSDTAPHELAHGESAQPLLRDSLNMDALNLDAMIHRHVVQVLQINHGNKLRAARQLGISRSTLYRILGENSPFSA